MNKLYYGDCLDVLQESIEDESIDLIYIDPPFNSKRNYNVIFESIDMSDVKAQKEAFADTWSNVKYLDELLIVQGINLECYRYIEMLDNTSLPKGAVSYLTTMALRLILMHRKLKPSGSFYLHCDPTMSHYLKTICDLIFGMSNYLNEIAWCYKEREISRRYWNRKHDILLFYAKDSRNERRPFNIENLYLSYSPGTIRKFNLIDDDGRSFQIRGKGGPYVGEQGLSIEIERLHPEWTYRDYLDQKPGILPRDWFDDIPFINRAAKERLGYPTQKPEALLERIISASSNEGDVVADFFCGCGTAVAIAQRLNRSWIGVDISHLAIKLIYNRLLESNRDNPDRFRDVLKNITINGFPRDIASAKELATSSRGGRLKFQDWVIEFLLGGVSQDIHKGYDGYLTLFRDSKKRDIVLVEVKSGNTKIEDIREFIFAIETQKAMLGIFVCFSEYATAGMYREARQFGYYESDVYGSKYPKLQIITIEDLLAGKGVLHPNPAQFNITFKKAF